MTQTNVYFSVLGTCSVWDARASNFGQEVDRCRGEIPIFKNFDGTLTYILFVHPRSTYLQLFVKRSYLHPPETLSPACVTISDLLLARAPPPRRRYAAASASADRRASTVRAPLRGLHGTRLLRSARSTAATAAAPDAAPARRSWRIHDGPYDGYG